MTPLVVVKRVTRVAQSVIGQNVADFPPMAETKSVFPIGIDEG